MVSKEVETSKIVAVVVANAVLRVALVVLAVGYFTGVDVTPLLDGAQQPQQTQSRQVSAEDERAGQFTSAVLATTEQVWTKIFRERLDLPYNAPVLVLYSGVTQSPCGGASGATGPFYCPADKKGISGHLIFHDDVSATGRRW